MVPSENEKRNSDLGPMRLGQYSCEGFLPRMEKKSQMFGPMRLGPVGLEGLLPEWKKSVGPL